ncbi:hypothetical protein Droror1_Dr00025530 [Drosera rotundifolia]
MTPLRSPQSSAATSPGSSPPNLSSSRLTPLLCSTSPNPSSSLAAVQRRLYARSPPHFRPFLVESEKLRFSGQMPESKTPIMMLLAWPDLGQRLEEGEREIKWAMWGDYKSGWWCWRVKIGV